MKNIGKVTFWTLSNIDVAQHCLTPLPTILNIFLYSRKDARPTFTWCRLRLKGTNRVATLQSQILPQNSDTRTYLCSLNEKTSRNNNVTVVLH
jgi:hypothetical protein